MILYKKYKKKKKCKTIFIGGFIFKEYEDNKRDKMHWIGSYKTCLLIISNYTHHLHEKIIIHHIIYIKKKIHINFKVYCRICELLGYCNNKQDWYNNGLILYFMHALWKEDQTTIKIILCAKCEIKTNLSIPRLEALTLTTYSPNIYNIFISL